MTGRVAVVTGGARGNGHMIARSLAVHGARVAVNDTKASTASETVAEIEDEGGEAMAIGADVSDEDAVALIMDQVVDEFGTVDILVNNAGIGGAGPFLEKENNSTFKNMLSVHLWGLSTVLTPSPTRWLNRVMERLRSTQRTASGCPLNTTSRSTV